MPIHRFKTADGRRYTFATAPAGGTTIHSGTGTATGSSTATGVGATGSTAPGTPTGLAASALSNSSLGLSWTLAGGTAATSVVVEQSANGVSGWFVVHTLGGTATTDTVTGLTAATSYYFRVKAVSGGGSSAYSATATGTTLSSGGSSTLLAASDVSYLGTYSVDGHALGLAFAHGLTSRTVGGQLRFLTLGYDLGNYYPVEMVFPIGNFAGGMTSAVQLATSSQFFGPYDAEADHGGLWFEDSGAGDGSGRLWANVSLDYPNGIQAQYTRSMTVRDISAGGSFSNLHGQYGLQGVGQRAIYGNVQRIPDAFRTAHGLGPLKYLVGNGGYSSLMAVGLGPSLGSMFAMIPEPTTYGDGTEVVIPSSAFKLIADHRGGATNNDWYGSGAPSSYDRGVRLAGSPPLRNYFDGGDPRGNPIHFDGLVNTAGTAVTFASGFGQFQPWWAGYSVTSGGVTRTFPAAQVVINGVAHTVATVTWNGFAYFDMTLTTSAGTQSNVSCTGPTNVPPFPPQDGAYWLSPAPDGKSRSVWGDVYNGTGCWIDGPSKKGFLAVYSGTAGAAYYGNSQVNGEAGSVQVHVFDPADFAAAAAGTLAPYAVQPNTMADVTSAIGSGGAIAGAAFDLPSKTLYLAQFGYSGYASQVHAFSVNC